ncbi:MAG: hemL [Chlamydiia bacterium]|nr:hemL [Chlamydiia bacterium]
MTKRVQSEKEYASLLQVIPGGVNSPVRAFKGLAITPIVVDHAFQDTLVDIDGAQYVDYCLSWGALIHGHAHPHILESVQKRIQKGTSYGCTTEIEGRLARKIISLMPSCEKVRFVSSGTEATMSAVRLARGFTGKSLMIKFTGGYHGHADHFLVQAGSGVIGLNQSATSAGIPQELLHWTACLPYNDIEAFDHFISNEKNAQNLACVIIEPIAANMGLVPADKKFLEHLRKRTKELNALLIFDEVVTGFRVAKGGAQSYYGVQPDLTCLGKIIGGGFPAAAFGGKQEIMDHLAPLGSVYQAGTLSGNPVAMEAGYQALCLLETPHFYEDLEEKTTSLTEPLVECINKHGVNACLQRVGSAFTLFFGRRSVTNMQEAKLCNLAQFTAFFIHLFERGIYIPPSQHEVWTVSSVHSKKNLEKTRDACLEYLKTCL